MTFRLFRIVLFMLALLIGASLSLRAQSPSDNCVDGDNLTINTSSKRYQCRAPNAQPAGTGSTMVVANAGVTGTTLNRLAKLTGAPSTAVITATTDTDSIVGIVTAGAGTTGDATITILGQASCEFDGATTAGDFFINSTTTVGKCHDAGSTYPSSSAVLGRVLSTNGAGGTYVVELMTPDVTASAGTSGNGKTKAAGSVGDVQVNTSGNNFGGVSPGTSGNVLTSNGSAWTSATPGAATPCGSSLDYQYNNAGACAGGRLKQTSTNVVSVSGGVSTPQTFRVYTNDNGASNAYLELSFAAGGERQIRSQGSSINNLRIGVGNTSYWEWGTSGVSFNADRAFDIGTATNRINQFFGYDIYPTNNLNFGTSGAPRLQRISDSQLHLLDGNGGTGAAIRLSFGDQNAGGPAINRPASSLYLETTVANSTSTKTFFVTAGTKFTSAQFDKTTNTTLANVTGLVSESLIAGKTYAFAAELFVDADVTGGSKYAIAGTATATDIKYHVDMICDATNLFVINSRQTALAGSVGQAGCTAGLTRISGTITVNAAGTLAVQFAQNAASGTSSVLTMSKFEVRQLN